MCGILGGLSNSELSKNEYDKRLHLLDHRGPDSSSSYLSPDGSLYLGHTRLAILDLSDSGSQPMFSKNHRYVITFNGEIYNFMRIKKRIIKKMPNYLFDGSSDTEILLAAIDIYGFKETLMMIEGMFAIGCWDKKEKKLYIARDRLGEKPLYYGVKNNSFFFASELKALSLFSDFQIDKNGLNLYMAQGNVPAPYSIYKNIFKIVPGTYLEVNTPHNYEIYEYWNTSDFTTISSNSFHQNFDVFENLFLNTINDQMISDVRLGAFLSGGLDSSAVVAAMSELSDKKIETHTIGFKESAYDESNAASVIAKHLGTKHNEFFLSADDAKSIIPRLSNIYCEPFSDSSQIPTYFLSKMTRTNVTVSLSGDGGDELFGGYNRYLFFDRFQKIINITPVQARVTVSRALNALMGFQPSRLVLSKIFQSVFNSRGGIEKLEKISKILQQDSLEDIYLSLIQQWHFDNWPIKESSSINPKEIYDDFLITKINSFNEMRLMDINNYLPNDILVKLDRASMAVSLESRLPFLNHKIVEFALSLPRNQLISRGRGKLMIRKFLESRIPNDILKLPKFGFGVPIQNWLRGDLKFWAYETIFSNRNDNLFDYDVLQRVWEEHQNGIVLRHHQLWSILMLKCWLGENDLGAI